MKLFLSVLAATLVAATLNVTSLQPAKADQAAVVRNILLGAAAVAGIAIEANVAHKNKLATTIEGYLQNGGTVYEDGHVVMPDGRSYYPGNYGQTIACNAGYCSISGTAAYNGYNNYNGYPGYNANAAYNPNYGGSWHQDANGNNVYTPYPNYNNQVYQSRGRTFHRGQTVYH
ncbi:MAG: hypothetical protein ACR2KS_11585 [Candidatus Eremiobacter antarcticus]